MANCIEQYAPSFGADYDAPPIQKIESLLRTSPEATALVHAIEQLKTAELKRRGHHKPLLPPEAEPCQGLPYVQEGQRVLLDIAYSIPDQDFSHYVLMTIARRSPDGSTVPSTEKEIRPAVFLLNRKTGRAVILGPESWYS